MAPILDSETDGEDKKPDEQASLKNVIKKNPQALGSYLPMLQSAAQRGDDALAVTHFLRMGTDEAYRNAYKTATSQ
jgi:hypothetical protein